VSAEGKVWLITGCSRGLGRALALRVLAAGHRVVATARDASTLAELQEAHPDSCHALALDVTAPAEIEAALQAAVTSFHRIDVVVNNAGRALLGALEEVGDEQIAESFALNFFGPLHVIRAALPLFRAQRAGHFVNISAAATLGNYPGFAIYGAAKSALESASEALAAEVKPLGIRVTSVVPGPLRTDFIRHSLDRASDSIADYDATSGKFARLLAAMDGRQTGDPDRAADAIFTAVQSDAPPSRLVLGKYAHDKTRRRFDTDARALAAWESIGQPIEYVS
jgi:NAD(P)-dependent dehydrogenase (short-subunit alcohol dehydrogenase family)